LRVDIAVELAAKLDVVCHPRTALVRADDGLVSPEEIQ
jgi:hypothetical protein